MRAARRVGRGLIDKHAALKAQQTDKEPRSKNIKVANLLASNRLAMNSTHGLENTKFFLPNTCNRVKAMNPETAREAHSSAERSPVPAWQEPGTHTTGPLELVPAAPSRLVRSGLMSTT